MTILNSTDGEQGITDQENGLLILIITYSMLTTLSLGAGTILSAAAYAKLQKEITFIQEHDARANVTSGGTQELIEDSNTILGEVAEGPLPQDNTTAAEGETQENEATMDSAIQWYLKTVCESIQNEIKQHMRPSCYIQGDFFHWKRHAVFALCDDSATGFNVDSLCAWDVFIWLPLLLSGAPDFSKCTCGDHLIKHGMVSPYL